MVADADDLWDGGVGWLVRDRTPRIGPLPTGDRARGAIETTRAHWFGLELEV